MHVLKPTIVDESAWAEFFSAARAANLDPEDRWVRDYVAICWDTARPYFLARGLPAQGSKVLEFGCNVGASSVMLAALGGEVTAIDISAVYVGIARANAKAHGQSERINFHHVPDTRRLPFSDQAFDLVVCNSVLEYVAPEHLPGVLDEIDRVLKPGGVLFVLGTSSRLWPKEVHSGVWLSNYLPRAADPLLRRIAPGFARGLSPWRLTHRFCDYENLDRSDKGRSFLAAKEQTAEGWKCGVLRLANPLTLALGASLGLLSPSITVAFRKP